MAIDYKRLRSLNARELIRALRRDGFREYRRRGAIRFFRHPGVGKRLFITEDVQTYLAHLESTIEPLREGWREEDVLYEVAMKEGYPLDSVIERVTGLATNTVFRVASPRETRFQSAPTGELSASEGQRFYVCLDAALVQEDIACLRLLKDAVFICRDVALTDTLAANLALQCRLKTI